MVDVLTGLSHAISITKRLREISANIKTAEFNNLLADLSLELADTRSRLADVLDGNTVLKARIRELENNNAPHCPRRHKPGWAVIESKPDPLFGRLGVPRRTYKCSECGFTEDKV